MGYNYLDKSGINAGIFRSNWNPRLSHFKMGRRVSLLRGGWIEGGGGQEYIDRLKEARDG